MEKILAALTSSAVSGIACLAAVHSLSGNMTAATGLGFVVALFMFFVSYIVMLLVDIVVFTQKMDRSAEKRHTTK